MRNLTFICTTLLLGICLSVGAQSTKVLAEEISSLKASQKVLQEEIVLLKSTTEHLNEDVLSLQKRVEQLMVLLSEERTIPSVQEKQEQPASTRCKAITAAGSQCSRNADAGSEYCWQHKNTYEPHSTPSNAVSTPKSTGSSSSGSTGAGRVIQTGPRGGKYYINSKGNKVYVK